MQQETIDNLTAQRMVHYLITPFNQWEACRIGIIDGNGKLKREPKTENEKQFFNMFHILAIRLKDLLKTSGRGTNWVIPGSAGEFYLKNRNIPSGNFTNWSASNRTSLPIFGAAYSSMKECVNIDDDDLFDSFFEMYLNNPNLDDMKEMALVLEDGLPIGNVSSNVELGLSSPFGNMSKYKSENMKKTAMKKIVCRLKGEKNVSVAP